MWGILGKCPAIVHAGNSSLRTDPLRATSYSMWYITFEWGEREALRAREWPLSPFRDYHQTHRLEQPVQGPQNKDCTSWPLTGTLTQYPPYSRHHCPSLGPGKPKQAPQGNLTQSPVSIPLSTPPLCQQSPQCASPLSCPCRLTLHSIISASFPTLVGSRGRKRRSAPVSSRRRGTGAQEQGGEAKEEMRPKLWVKANIGNTSMTNNVELKVWEWVGCLFFTPRTLKHLTDAWWQ